jgi:two-component system, NarL family, response regulator LiaR
MKKTILVYGLALALLTALLKFLEYHYVVRDLSLEFYLGVIAFLFTSVGIWAGLKLTRRKQLIVAAPSSEFVVNEANLKTLNISKREHEVLTLMAQGMTNQEIADKLFVSLNTVKTHLSNLFQKLEVSRRTQAVQKGKELRLIP